MGRGKSAKTKVKEAASLSVPLLLAEKLASQQAELKKPIALILRDKVVETPLSEDMELVAVLGTTIILASSLEFIKATAEGIRQTGQVIIENIQGILHAAIEVIVPETGYIKEGIRKGSLPNLSWAEWLVCFSVAYVLVHNAGLIIQAGGNIIIAGINMVKSLALPAVVP